LAILLLLFLCLPSPEDHRNDHSLISQLFYGRHLQPVLLNVDIKAFLTTRLALTLWALYLLSALFENRQRFPDKLFSRELFWSNFMPGAANLSLTQLGAIYNNSPRIKPILMILVSN
jgi:hypothetical protein